MSRDSLRARSLLNDVSTGVNAATSGRSTSGRRSGRGGRSHSRQANIRPDEMGASLPSPLPVTAVAAAELVVWLRV